MTKSNSSATLSTSNLYEHPWYSQLKLLENTMTCESPLQPKLKSEVTGQKSTRYCKLCSQHRPLSDFDRKYCGGNKDETGYGYVHRCRTCDKEYNRSYRAAKKNAPPKPDHCECCGTKDKKLCVDHVFGEYVGRGWLCKQCNNGIGLLGDNLQGLLNAVNYLQTHGNQI